jgi:hypothetical protein
MVCRLIWDLASLLNHSSSIFENNLRLFFKKHKLLTFSSTRLLSIWKFETVLFCLSNGRNRKFFSRFYENSLEKYSSLSYFQISNIYPKHFFLNCCPLPTLKGETADIDTSWEFRTKFRPFSSGSHIVTLFDSLSMNGLIRDSCYSNCSIFFIILSIVRKIIYSVSNIYNIVDLISTLTCFSVIPLFRMITFRLMMVINLNHG